MAKTKYDDRTRQQIASDTLEEKGLFGTIGTYLSGKMPRSESMDDPQGRLNRRRKGMETLKQREAEGKRRAAALKRKKDQEIRKNKAARVLAERKKEGEERAARLRSQKEEQISTRRAAPVVAKAAGQATGETAKQSAVVAATKPAPKATAPKPKAPAAKTPASKTPAPKARAPKAKGAKLTSSKTTPAPTGDKKYNVGVSKGGVPFKEAFKFHRDKALKGGSKTFTWNGKKYTTELKTAVKKKPVKKMGGGMMKSKMASKGGARGGRKAMGMKKGGFPDLNKDGKVTQADILQGRGVTKKAMGGMMKSKGMAKGGAMKKKGYAMGGAVKKKGMAKGGAVSRKPTKPRGVGAAKRGYGKAMK